ncbi:MAG: hypothetical protein ACLFTB_02525 [Desulfovibrionales bacterium]
MLMKILPFLLVVLVSACAPGPPPLYPPSPKLEQGAAKRVEYIQAFLEGRWCDARYLFAESRDAFLRRDDFCAVATNYLYAWKLHSYLGQEDPLLLQEALHMSRIGRSCPDIEQAAQGAVVQTERESEYRSLIRDGRFDELTTILDKESDPLFRSVYARKAAGRAYKEGQALQAKTLLEQALQTDAAHGWTVFLVEDWKLFHALETDAVMQKRISDRITRLGLLIQDCSESR